jgi:diguanylate cyclase (GGDEF)-like protein
MDLERSRAGAEDGADARDTGGWLRPGPHLLAGLAVLLLGLYISVGTAQLERERQLSARQAQVQRELADFHARLAAEIWASVALARGLAVIVVQQEGITDTEFQAIARELRHDQKEILYFSLAPGFVVTQVFPRAGASEVGLRLLDDPRHKEPMLRSIRLDAPVLAGPFPREDGSQGLAVRMPLWVEKDRVPRLWGAVGVVLDYELILRRAGIRQLEEELRVSFVGRDAGGPGGALFRGERPERDASAVRSPVMLPGGSWLVSAVPVEGWYRDPRWLSPGFLARVLLSLLAGLATARILDDRRRIRRLASRDELTDLPNRRWALAQLARLIQRHRRGGGGFALMSLDLDGFKPVNDTYGHAAGDLLLAEIGRRMSHIVRPGDVVARMGGDEFLVLVPTEPSNSDDWLRAVATRVQTAISRPVPIEGHWVVVGTSIGIARFPDDGDLAETLLRKADAAMYRAKHGRDQGIEFAAAMPRALPSAVA